MDTFTRLTRTVAEALASQRIGLPVSVRAHFHLTADHGLLLPILEAALAAAEKWFASSATRAYALGGARHGEITALVEYTAGQTALVSVAVLRDPLPRTDILLLGNRGTLRFQESVTLGADGASHPKLRAALERSLTTQAPAEVER